MDRDQNFYGAGIVRGMKKWTPHLKIQDQLAKYIRAYGPDGAVILRHGVTPSCVAV